MRAAVACIHQESNLFNPVLTTLADFDILEGKAVLENLGFGSLGLGYSQLAGITSSLQKRGVDVIPLMAADALPGGPVSGEAYEHLKSMLLRGLRRALPVDGVCLALHGSMYVKDLVHGESDLLSSVRAFVGKKVPILASLDIHANVTDAMISSCDALTTYRTIPHSDAFEAGERAAKLLLHAMAGNRITMAASRLPLLVHGETAETDTEPMSSIIQLLRRIDSRSGVLSSSLATGDIGGDVYDNGTTAIVVSDEDQEVALREADSLAASTWEKRGNFRFKREAYEMDKGIDIAIASPTRPVFASDLGDDPTAGGTSDTTAVLERLVAKGVTEAALAAICDSRAVDSCAEAGVGAQVSLSIGGKMDTSSRSLSEEVKVLDVLGHTNAGMGRVAIVDVKGIKLALTEKRIAITDPVQLIEMGLDPRDFKLVVLKMGYLFPKFQQVASRSILLLSPGSTNFSSNWKRYKRIRRPIYPLDPDTTWERAYS